jgi:hypothetical protein
VTKHCGPMLAHYEFRQEAEESVIGTRMEKVTRLQANLGVCLAMAAVSAVNTVSAIFTLH